MLSDIKVFVINEEQIASHDSDVTDLSDDEFMALAEDGGEIYSLSEFEEVFNSDDSFDDINPAYHFIRFIRP